MGKSDGTVRTGVRRSGTRDYFEARCPITSESRDGVAETREVAFRPRLRRDGVIPTSSVITNEELFIEKVH